MWNLSDDRHFRKSPDQSGVSFFGQVLSGAKTWIRMIDHEPDDLYAIFFRMANRKERMVNGSEFRPNHNKSRAVSVSE